MKRIRFWGTRGSLPIALTASGVRHKLMHALRGAAGRSFTSDDELAAYVDGLAWHVSGTYGGHTSCVEIETGGTEYILCDLGSGLRPFGQQIMARHGPASPQTYHVFMSHVHWDHIMGFPFFTPAYIPGNHIRIYGAHAVLEEALRRQQAAPSFPVDFSILGADIEFVRLEPGRRYDIAGLSVSLMRQRHGGDSYGYRFTSGGKTVIYSTDSEHALNDLSETELCQMAGARHLCLFHHEPAHNDEALDRILNETRRLEAITRTGQPLLVTAAYDGMEIDL